MEANNLLISSVSLFSTFLFATDIKTIGWENDWIVILVFEMVRSEGFEPSHR
jgi:hypothetical protein